MQGVNILLHHIKLKYKFSFILEVMSDEYLISLLQKKKIFTNRHLNNLKLKNLL